MIKTWKYVGLYIGNIVLPHGLVYCDLTGTRDKIFFFEEGGMCMIGALAKKKRDDVPNFYAVAGPPGETDLRVTVS